jgi:iron complex outermembrane receptor protein
LKQSRDSTAGQQGLPLKSASIAALIFIVFLAFFPVKKLFSQEAEGEGEEEIIVLPGVELVEPRDTTERITQEDMEREDSDDLWEAVRNIPGFVRDGGGGMRNESNFTIRGMDERMVPAFIDGVPLAAPYRGEADNARFLTADLEDVEIHKGYSSMLLGANTLGGALIMRTARPKKPLEVFFKTGVDFDSVFKYSGLVSAFGAGSKQESFYGKFVLQTRLVDHTRLPASFVPDPLNLQQKGERLFSDTSDLKISALAGWTPSGPLSVNASYILQDADKGVSPEETEGAQTMFSVWTLWQRNTVSFDINYNDELMRGKALFFLDKFDNTLASASSLEEVAERRWENPSTYDDYSAGFRLEGARGIKARHLLSAAFTFKQDGHKDDKDGVMTKEIRENTFSLGLEYEVNPSEPFTFTAGLGADFFKPDYLWSINELSQSDAVFVWSAQAGVFFDFFYGGDHGLHLTVAKKNHIPTMRMRYSETLMDSNQSVVPNPGLKPEEALNSEAGYKGAFSFTDKLRLSVNAALYGNYVYNLLAEETTPEGIRRINAGKTFHYGFEAGLKLFATHYLSAGGAASIARYHIEYSPEGYTAIGNYPAFTANVHIVISPFAGAKVPALASLSIIPSLEYEGPRYGSSRMINLNAANVLRAFTLFNLKAVCDITENFKVEAAILNLGDENYSLQDGALPMPGLSFTFAFTGRY